MSINSILFTSVNEQITMQYYNDIICSTVFNSQISFLSKYNQLNDYSTVLTSQYIIKSIVSTIIKSNPNKLNQIKSIVNQQLNKIQQQSINQHHQQQHQQHQSQQHINQLLIQCISQSIFNRLQQIKQSQILRAVSLGQLHLIDINWKITKTISSQAKSFIGSKLPYLFKLTLYLKSNLSTNTSIQSISLELSKVQLKQFIAQLKSMKGQM